VPLRVEDGVWGVVTLSNAESGRTFGENDITLAIELGRRAGNAVENARLYQAAHHASETKSDFLAVMSHELRTPLNAIIGYSDLLLMGVPNGVPEAAHRQIQRIRSASTSLLHLVEEVLSFSRIEAGKEDIRISPVEIGAVLRECVAMIEPLAAEKGLEVNIEQPATPLKVVSDERKIRQVLTNLLSNAVKFTESGSIVVTAHQQTGEVHIEVRDTGIGISPENLERIFDPFWQVEQSATRRFGGTGLGLGVARKLAKLLEGRLEVESRVDEGSVFTLILPAHTPGMQRFA
jgi:signal transduction histidine kinase